MHTMRRTRSFIWIIILLMLAGLAPVAQPARSQSTFTVYLPIVNGRQPLPSIFGIEVNAPYLNDGLVNSQAQQLGAHWVRMNNEVQWHLIQPTPERNYRWDLLASFEQSLAGARAAGLEPVVIVNLSPRWATTSTVRCGSIREDKFGDFAAFLEALASRYKDQVRYWEIGNEIDVDPVWIETEFSVIGCWGNISDPYYGGGYYGQMLKAVTPAIKRGNPNAKVVFGGLLLDSPDSRVNNPGVGRPELFLEGALRAGAGNAFDILAYHAYAYYSFREADYDLELDNWRSLGGGALGKARFLRETMRRYGVDKPLWLNEIGLLCARDDICGTSPPEFYLAQATHVVRVVSRAAANRIEQVVWYTLNGPGWRDAALLDANQQPRPVYNAYRHMIQTVAPYIAVYAVEDYGPEIESYRFDKGGRFVDVLWSRDGSTRAVNVPNTRFQSASSRDGTPLSWRLNGQSIEVNAGFSPIYIERMP